MNFQDRYFSGTLRTSSAGSRRFYHDSYGIDAHTFGLAWFQKIGKYVGLSPVFRHYFQSEADFYATRFPDSSARPGSYSGDYRLSQSQSFTYGVVLSVKPTEWLTLDAGYKRYVMEGLDNVTSQSAYPSANVFTLGARLWF